MIQLQVLNKILTNKDSSMITMNNLTSEFFSDYKSEFDFVNNHLTNYGKLPDMESFLSKFNSFEVIKVTETDSYLLSELYKDKNTRFLAKTFNKVRDLLMEDKVEDALSLYRKASENLSTGVSLNSIDVLRDTSRYEAYVERTKDFEKYYISTGFKELDKIIGGWDRQEELATIAARTNHGKTWVLLKMASAAAEQGLNVGLYSGEMTERKVGYRIDTLIGHISNGSLIHGNENIMNDYKKYIDELPNKYKGSLRVLTPASINGPAGVGALRAFIQKEKLDILFIDQHSLLEDDRKGRGAVEKAANISKDLKNLQVVTRIPIISVSQQNRAINDNGTLDTTQIAQSDRIAQDSTVILMFEKKEDLLSMYLVKSRDSENGKKLQYKVDLNKGLFNYIPSEDDANNGSGYEDLEHRYDVVDNGSEVFV